MHKKDKEIDKDIINRYIKYSSPVKVAGVQSKTRKYLLDKMENDAKNHKEV